uniref:Fibronectin type-III domain-containing protein n=1 Tax=Anser cygnoides TaxID=8845 RepID=A0A8B9EFU2_ANSCY
MDRGTPETPVRAGEERVCGCWLPKGEAPHARHDFPWCLFRFSVCISPSSARSRRHLSPSVGLWLWSCPVLGSIMALPGLALVFLLVLTPLLGTQEQRDPAAQARQGARDAETCQRPLWDPRLRLTPDQEEYSKNEEVTLSCPKIFQPPFTHVRCAGEVQPNIHGKPVYIEGWLGKGTGGAWTRIRSKVECVEAFQVVPGTLEVSTTSIKLNWTCSLPDACQRMQATCRLAGPSSSSCEAEEVMAKEMLHSQNGTFTCPPLQPFTVYSVTISVPPSTILFTRLLRTKATVPEKPERLWLDASTGTLRWQALPSCKGEILGYQLNVTTRGPQDGGFLQVERLMLSSSVTEQPLPAHGPGTSYTVAVRGLTAAGAGAALLEEFQTNSSGKGLCALPLLLPCLAVPPADARPLGLPPQRPRTPLMSAPALCATSPHPEARPCFPSAPSPGSPRRAGECSPGCSALHSPEQRCHLQLPPSSSSLPHPRPHSRPRPHPHPHPIPIPSPSPSPSHSPALQRAPAPRGCDAQWHGAGRRLLGGAAALQCQPPARRLRGRRAQPHRPHGLRAGRRDPRARLPQRSPAPGLGLHRPPPPRAALPAGSRGGRLQLPGDAASQGLGRAASPASSVTAGVFGGLGGHHLNSPSCFSQQEETFTCVCYSFSVGKWAPLLRGWLTPRPVPEALSHVLPFPSLATCCG